MRKQAKPIDALKQSFRDMLASTDSGGSVAATVMNLALLSNPILKEQEGYRVLSLELSQYNKRVLDKIVTDQYEVLSHEKLFGMVSDLANIDQKDDMVARLEDLREWWTEQCRKIRQRKDRGVIKYKTDRHIDKLRDYRERMSHS